LKRPLLSTKGATLITLLFYAQSQTTTPFSSSLLSPKSLCYMTVLRYSCRKQDWRWLVFVRISSKDIQLDCIPYLLTTSVLAYHPSL
jgi:hypothetical protein